MKEQGAEEWFNDSPFTTIDLIETGERTLGLNTEVFFECLESYHRHRLESITEERIKELFPEPELSKNHTAANEWMKKGAKALLDYLKQPR